MAKKILIKFTDFKKACDKVNRGIIWTILKQYGIPRMVKLLNKYYWTFLEHNGKTSEPIDINCGTRQGNIVVLFPYFIQWVDHKKYNKKYLGITMEV